MARPAEKKRWGFWPTLGFSVGLIFLCLMVHVVLMVAMTAFSAMGNPELDGEAYLKSLIKTGFYVSLSTVVSAWVGTLGIVAFILLRKGITVKEYLPLKRLPFRTYALWLGMTIVFVIGMILVAMVIEPPNSDWMIKSYQTAESLPLFWIAVVIGAPLLEEMFFRGFLFEGLRDSRLGSVGAVLVTASLWAAIHMQYQVFGLSVILTLGLLLGVAKIKTRSLYIPLAMHAFYNFIIMAQISLYFMQNQQAFS